MICGKSLNVLVPNARPSYPIISPVPMRLRLKSTHVTNEYNTSDSRRHIRAESKTRTCLLFKLLKSRWKCKREVAWRRNSSRLPTNALLRQPPISRAENEVRIEARGSIVVMYSFPMSIRRDLRMYSKLKDTH